MTAFSPLPQSDATDDEAVKGGQTLKFNAEVPSKWYALAINLARTTPNQNFGPTNSRAFGYMGLRYMNWLCQAFPEINLFKAS